MEKFFPFRFRFSGVTVFGKKFEENTLYTVPEALSLRLTQKIVTIRLVSEFSTVFSNQFSKISQKS